MGKKDLSQSQTRLLQFNKLGVVKKELLYSGYSSISKPNPTVEPANDAYVSNLAISSESKSDNSTSKVRYLRIKNNGTKESNRKKATGRPPDSLSDRRREWP